MANLEEAFERAHPDIDFVHEMLMGNEYDTVLYARDAAGTLPDAFTVFNIGEAEVMRWAKAGKITSVDNLKVVKQLPEAEKNALTLSNGNIYAVVNSSTAAGIVYNKELYKKAGITSVPRTLDEMTAACEKLKAAGITPFIAGAKDGWTMGNQIWKPGLDAVFPYEWNAKRQANEASFHDYGMGMFDFIDLYIANTQSRPLDADYTTQMALFAEGDGAMICQGLWVYNSIISMNPDMESKMGFMPIPFTNDKTKNNLYTQQELAWLISASSDIDAVDTFFDFMINSPEGREIFSRDFAVINPYGIGFEPNPVTADALSYIEAGEYMFNHHENSFPAEFFMVHSSSMQEYMGGTITKEAILDRMDAKWLEAMSK
ncbi:MAG: extracellular solute-binding protein [Spirochaetales bacterium]|nr:extracellular solute-binding protein [Spirochaetales bacterium]